MEEEIELELSSISLNGDAEEESLSEEKYEEYEAVTDCGEDETEELPESILSYLQVIKKRNENTEKLILQDVESDIWLRSESIPTCDSDYLAELASEFGQDPESLKKQVLADIEEEERREQMSGDSSSHHGHNTFQETQDADKLDNGTNMAYTELEERCKQKLQEWEDEHKKLSEVTSSTFNSHREIIGEQISGNIENKEDWRKVEREISELNIAYAEQQKKLDEDLQKKQEILAEELEKHTEMIFKMKADLEKEINTWEEQKTEAKKHLEELQYKSAVKIQATYRAFYTYKKYAPFLKEKKEEKRRKEELKHKLEQEKREMEERIKLKLEEKKRREEEKKQKEETMKREMEEASIRERLQQELRQKEYEKKKSEERQRLEKAKLIQEEQKSKLIRTETEKTRIMSENRNTKTTRDAREDLNKKQAGNSHLGKEIDKNVDDIKHEGPLEIQEKEIKQKDARSGENFETSGLINLNEQVLPEEISNIMATSVDKVLCSIVEDNLTSEELPVQYGNKVRLAEAEKQCMLEQNPDISLDISDLTPDEPYVEEDNRLSSLPCQGTLLERPVNRSTNVNVAVQKECVLKEHSEGTLVSVSSRSLVLPDHVEEKRLTWMKSCKPWAKILRDNQRKKTSTFTKKRKGSAAQKLSPLNEKLIFQNSPWHDLKQVTTVTLQDLPGCCLTTLSKCTKLRYLSMRRCNLITLEGIRDCKDLEFIDVQENCINVINCEGMENLKVLLLNKNQISSIHGVENCTNLMNLEISFNLITRIGGVETLRNLQRLVLDHNQLISTRGLQAVPTLLYLDCSYNHLTELEGIQNCGLLQILKLQGNNLCEFPKLDNHVLLRELYLDDNSISAVNGLSVYWLPLLQVLSISQNSLAQMESLNTFISLEELDLRNNCLSDVQSISLWLEGCVNLKRLLLNKNPLTQEANWRYTLLKLLPGLRLLNDEHLYPKEDTNGSVAGTFLAFCQAQIQVIRRKWQMLHAGTYLKDLESYCDTLEELMKLSSEHRYAHEYGDIEDTEREDPEILANIMKPPGIDSSQHNSLVISGANENKQDDSTRQITFRQLVNSSANPKGRDQEKNSEKTSAETKVTENISYAGNVKNKIVLCETRKPSMCMPSTKSKEHSAAIIIQSHWRGYMIRRDIDYYTKLHRAASLIQCAWRNYSIKKRYLQRKKYNKSDLPDTRNWAAIVIQAAWKGFYLRKKLAAAFAAIEREELEDDFKEVNLDDFTFDENELEKEWTLESTDFPSAVLHCSKKPGQSKFPKAFTAPEDGSYSLSWNPVEAWQDSNGSETNSAFTYERMDSDSKLEKQNVSHVSSTKSPTDGSFRSEREEKMSQEWGFKDSATAQLMLKRAQKMKSKQAKNKKMLDPAVRLALFKNNENKHVSVKPPKKAPLMKVGYFQDVEEYSHLCEVPSETLARSRDLTYQWLHTQCGEFEPASPTIPKCRRFLPELNHDVLNGGRVQLVANASKEDDDLEIVSVNSGRDLMQKKSRNSGTHRLPAATGRDLFTPPKTHSGPQRKERISFRDNPTQLSGGWGSGKKREKTFK
ncbi:leucine-rich repeat and IQ domain-containing protein 1 [Spea bombifrons]|uniref:leucine-rich repeat and IQ domain-containing protein 1 n=1 Tax=Spea bombifrons TaxID=233779 RepID=UPI00234B8FA0|nr:leucine-rich repeat and IQ domain-containing protein 1 [Spea bombifrons]